MIPCKCTAQFHWWHCTSPVHGSESESISGCHLRPLTLPSTWSLLPWWRHETAQTVARHPPGHKLQLFPPNFPRDRHLRTFCPSGDKSGDAIELKLNRLGILAPSYATFLLHISIMSSVTVIGDGLVSLSFVIGRHKHRHIYHAFFLVVPRLISSGKFKIYYLVRYFPMCLLFR